MSKNIIKIEPVDLSVQVDKQVAKANNLLEQAKKLIVTDRSGAEVATAKAKEIKELGREAENLRTQLKDPFLKAGRLIDGEFKRITTPCDEAEKNLKSKILAFQKEEDRKAREQEEKRRREAKEAALREAEMLATQGDSREAERVLERAMDIPPVESEARGPIRASGGAAAGIRKTWTYEIVDSKQVPGQFLTIDDKAVKAAIAAGVRTIPGIRIYERESVAIS